MFTPHGWADHRHWQSVDRAMARRVDRLLDDPLPDPFAGIGKPEPLRHILQGRWSRRLDDEHRLVNLVDGEDVVALQTRCHCGS